MLENQIEQLKEEFPWFNHPAFVVEPNREGFYDYMFGCRAGPSVDISNLFHEVAHAIEFPKERWQMINERGWPFKVPRRWVYDRHIVEPVTSQMTEREVRTMAIQKHLLERASCCLDEDLVTKAKWDKTPISYEKWCGQILDYLPDWYTLGKSFPERRQNCEKMIKEFYNSFDPDLIDPTMCEFFEVLSAKRAVDNMNHEYVLED